MSGVDNEADKYSALESKITFAELTPVTFSMYSSPFFIPSSEISFFP